MFNKILGAAALVATCVSAQAADSYYPFARALLGAHQTTLNVLARECENLSGVAQEGCYTFIVALRRDLKHAEYALQEAESTRNGPGPGVANEENTLSYAGAAAALFAENLSVFYSNLRDWRAAE